MRAERLFPKDPLATTVLLGATAFFLAVFWYPITQTFLWSLQDRVYGQGPWIGLQNYQNLMSDQVFLNSLQVSARYTLMVVPAVVVLGLLLAVLVNAIASVTLRGLFTASYFLAYVVPLVAVAVVWRYMMEPSRLGLFNAMLATFNVPPVRWLADADTALLSLAIVGVWKTIGYAMVIYLAGLQGIPDIYYEAAAIDGAGRWKRFRHITLPLLAPISFFVLIVTTLGALMMFVETYVMTSGGGGRGGPNYATTTVVFNIFETAFSYQREGYASAMAVVLFVIIILVTLVQFRVLRDRVEI
jgi:multiple sugar transport system permease protein